MAEIFDIEEIKDQEIYEQHTIRPRAEYKPDPFYKIQQAATGKEPEVAFRETPMYDQHLENIQKSLPKTLYSLLKGMVQGEVGLPGDIEDIAQSANVAGRAYFADPKNEAEYEALMAQLEKETLFPTTEEVKESMDKYVPTMEGFESSEKIGEYLSPGVMLLAGMRLLKNLFKQQKTGGAAFAATTKEGLENDNQ